MIPYLSDTIARMKHEILRDMAAGVVPRDCASFSQLHDYVDANCYGGFCDGGLLEKMIAYFGGRGSDEGMPDNLMWYINTAQNSVDTWMRRRDYYAASRE